MKFGAFVQEIMRINPDNFVFRGQANVRWPLITSYTRFFNKTQKGKQFSLSLFETMLSQFIKQISEFQNKDYRLLPEYQQIATAQHYGIPTPFLDWSKSPFIAAYFAAFDNICNDYNNNEVVVYALNIQKIEEKGYNYDPNERVSLLNDNVDIRFINTCNFYSKRITSQQGCFTFHRTQEDLMDLTENVPDFVIRYVIEDTVEIIKNLKLIGINSCNLYQDIDYISKDVTINAILNNLNNN